MIKNKLNFKTMMYVFSSQQQLFNSHTSVIMTTFQVCNLKIFNNKRKLFEYQVFIQHEVSIFFFVRCSAVVVACYFQQIAIKLKTIFPDVQFFYYHFICLVFSHFVISFSLIHFFVWIFHTGPFTTMIWAFEFSWALYESFNKQ